ncbi:hypothetical protein HNW77_11805 [Komagataeibacter sp. AV436]|uniref:Uncharacterized protein n=1 Tax=Komagataeibacter melomenusus TaxID=2766578 RepID=A0ABX2AG70_9PROT|nr:hypothetical protein [Komagataeibacter melomenusus]MBV1831322.1 hypothetical protein [Komagataeibacter melomenusus]NPC67062.1 hypothetical protein [Komagataeibacter melomenusus]
MTETKTQGAKYYAVPAQLTYAQREAFYHALDCVMPLEEAFAIVGTPIQPYSNVETVGYVPDKANLFADKRLGVTNIYRSAGDPWSVPLVRRTDMEAQIAALNNRIEQLKSCLANIRATCLQAGEGPTPANSMVAAGMRAMHLADAALNGEGRA